MDTNGRMNLCEDYVSFETAKLLKEKGFDGQCLSKYNSYGCFWDNIRYDGMLLGNNDIFPQEYLAPTIQMAMKWLREVHELQCQIDCPLIIFNWRYGIRDLNKDEWVTPRNIGDYDTYEKACEAAIKYCLENLI